MISVAAVNWTNPPTSMNVAGLPAELAFDNTSAAGSFLKLSFVKGSFQASVVLIPLASDTGTSSSPIWTVERICEITVVVAFIIGLIAVKLWLRKRKSSANVNPSLETANSISGAGNHPVDIIKAVSSQSSRRRSSTASLPSIDLSPTLVNTSPLFLDAHATDENFLISKSVLGQLYASALAQEEELESLRSKQQLVSEAPALKDKSQLSDWNVEWEPLSPALPLVTWEDLVEDEIERVDTRNQVSWEDLVGDKTNVDDRPDSGGNRFVYLRFVTHFMAVIQIDC